MDTRPASLRSTMRQLVKFVGFVSRTFGAFYWVVGLTFLVLTLEYAATSLMIPLSSQAPGKVAHAWGGVLTTFGLAPMVRTWLWLFFLIMTARLFFGYLQTSVTTLLGKQVHRYLSGHIFEHVVLTEPLTSIYTRTVGYYITLAGDDTFRCGTIISNLLQCVVGFSTAVVAMAVLYQFSVPLFSGVLVFLVACAVTIALLFKYLLKTNGKATQLSRELGTSFVESLNSLRSIRALRGEKFVVDGYARQIADYVHLLFRIDVVRAGIKAMPAILLLAIAAVLIRPGSTLFLSEVSLFAGTVIVIRIFASLGQLVAATSTLLTDTRAVRDIELLVRESAIVEVTEPSHGRVPVKSIAIRHIGFGYVERMPLIAELDFRFESGKVYAIVGPSGSGKSTLADIMLGLLRPDRGFIEVNDGLASIAAVHHQFALVEQQPKIFSGSLRANLLFGATATDDSLWRILELVDLAQSVRRLPGGLDTPLSYLGENFSGGQRQRIGIARALVREPDVLLLDEATSALDPKTRAHVVAKLRSHMREGIIIFVTHDEDIAALADGVLVIGAPAHLADLHAEPVLP